MIAINLPGDSDITGYNVVRPSIDLTPGVKPLHRYRVTKLGTTLCVTIEAMYYNLEDGFFVFKDSSHATVYTVNSTTVEDIVRVAHTKK